MLTRIVEILLVLLLGGGVPLLSYLTFRKSDIRLVPRPAIYLSAVISQWLLVGVGAGAMWATSRSYATVGFRPIRGSVFLFWTAGLTAGSLALVGTILWLERRGWWPEETGLVRLLLPQTSAEKAWAVFVLAPTAGFAEEFLYRGLLLAVLSHGLYSIGWSWGVSSAAFGLAHVYQGRMGMIRAAGLGALLAYPVVHLGTLYPSMAAHFLIDAVALAWMGPSLLRPNTITEETMR